MQPFPYNHQSRQLTLSISSPLTCTGTVTIYGSFNGPFVTVTTNCGDTNLWGNYVRTNLTAQEQADWLANGVDPGDFNYVKGANWIGFGKFYGVFHPCLFSYDRAAQTVLFLYVKNGDNLDGDDWFSFYDYATPPPTTICAQTNYALPFAVAAGTATNIVIPPLAVLQNDGLRTNSINVAASRPVCVYGLIYERLASAAFTAYPTPLLGTNYSLMAYPGANQLSPSEFSIVATTDNTTNWITPSSNANLADGHTGTYSVVLNRGQTYLNYSSNGAGDVTGTRIQSDKPVAVFAGADLADVPDANTQAQNPLMQEQLPEWFP